MSRKRRVSLSQVQLSDTVLVILVTVLSTIKQHTL